VPIFTFMNKLDRPARPPLELLDELERVLAIQALPLNWPLGSGGEFRGVYDRHTREVHLFERTAGGTYRAPVEVTGSITPSCASDGAGCLRAVPRRDRAARRRGHGVRAR
jgi:peptide subunit release factor RF-3